MPKKIRLSFTADELVDTILGWRGATPATQARLLERCCASVRPGTIVTNSITALLVSAFILAQTWSTVYGVWLAAALAGGIMPRAWAAYLRRQNRFDEEARRKALTFVGISVIYGLIWGVGPLLILPVLTGASAALFLIIIILGTIMGAYAAMPGVLYARLICTGVPTVIAVGLNMTPMLGLVSAMVFWWLVLRADIWRGYHRVLRQEIELHETLSTQSEALQAAHDAVQRVNNDLKILAETDPLTGIANRRHFLEQCESLAGPAAMMILDIDRFKSINDRFGHQTGDFVLMTLSCLTQEALRGDDVVARIGGDEFALLLPNVTPGGACKIAERIRATAEGCTIESGKKRPLRFTVSLGVSSITPDMTCADVSALLQHADRLLYNAKQNGRNQICADTWRPERQRTA
ncbi:MAG TPA: GGDEF domain-containing protein [Gammaproteobacteria bacterium]|nr:GGDEF domain-containing protein [Gammaproteobacteria bacterium]